MADGRRGLRSVARSVDVDGVVQVSPGNTSHGNESLAVGRTSEKDEKTRRKPPLGGIVIVVFWCFYM